jgi:hypothetical protein
MPKYWGNEVVPVKLEYCLNMSSDEGPKKTKTSKIPDSDIQWVVVVVDAGPSSSDDPFPDVLVLRQALAIGLGVACLVMSIQVSAPLSQNTPTVEPARTAFMKGIAPYVAISESAKYSKMSVLYKR